MNQPTERPIQDGVYVCEDKETLRFKFKNLDDIRITPGGQTLREVFAVINAKIGELKDEIKRLADRQNDTDNATIAIGEKGKPNEQDADF